MPPWSMQSTNKSIPNGDYQIYCLKLLILIAPNIHYLGINDIWVDIISMKISYPINALHIYGAFY